MAKNRVRRKDVTRVTSRSTRASRFNAARDLGDICARSLVRFSNSRLSLSGTKDCS